MKITEHIKNEFGSKKGLLRFFWFQFLFRVGLYRRYEEIDFSKVNRLIFICMGNICRSPLAEAVAKNENVSCMSFGLDTRGGDGADMRTIRYGLSRGLDLTSHKTKKISQYSYQEGDLLVVMEPKHIKMLPESLKKVPITFAGLWLRDPILYLHDPYNASARYFEKCENLVQLSTKQLISDIIKNG